MNFTLERTEVHDWGQISSLHSEDGNHLYWTLERTYLQADGTWVPKLPNGIYSCVFGDHNLDSGPVQAYEIMNISGHQGILIHRGCYSRDSEGCILIGMSLNSAEKMICASEVAFNQFMTLQDGKDFTLTVIE